jgi:hypothetical protein
VSRPETAAKKFTGSTSDYADGSHLDIGDRAYQNNKSRVSGVTPAESKAIDAYTLHSFQLNDHLRSGGVLSKAARIENPSTGTTHDPADLDRVIGRHSLPENTELWRGTYDSNRMFGPVGSKIGQRFTDHGFVSTSTNRSETDDFGADDPSGARIRILAPKGTRGMAVGGHSTLYGDTQREILLHRDQTFHVVRDKMSNGRREIELHVIPGEQ